MDLRLYLKDIHPDNITLFKKIANVTKLNILGIIILVSLLLTLFFYFISKSLS